MDTVPDCDLVFSRKFRKSSLIRKRTCEHEEDKHNLDVAECKNIAFYKHSMPLIKLMQQQLTDDECLEDSDKDDSYEISMKEPEPADQTESPISDLKPVGKASAELLDKIK